MNPRLGWGLAAVALVVGATGYGWRGFAFAASIVVFWLLLQFNRSIKVMRAAAEGPIGKVPSAVMLQAKLKVGMPMLQVVTLTRTLGKPLGGVPENWGWADDSGAEVRIAFDQGRALSWALIRPDADPDANAAARTDTGTVTGTGAATQDGVDAPSLSSPDPQPMQNRP